MCHSNNIGSNRYRDVPSYLEFAYLSIRRTLINTKCLCGTSHSTLFNSLPVTWTLLCRGVDSEIGNWCQDQDEQRLDVAHSVYTNRKFSHKIFPLRPSDKWSEQNASGAPLWQSIRGQPLGICSRQFPRQDLINAGFPSEFIIDILRLEGHKHRQYFERCY